MKARIILVFAACVSLMMSCAPTRYMMEVETRHTPKSGVDLFGKNVSIIYGQNGNSNEDVVLESIAEGMSVSLGEKYQNTIGEVNLFSLKSAPQYASKDSLLTLLAKTGADVVFLLDKVTCSQERSYSYLLICYDGMNHDDKIQTFTGHFIANSTKAVSVLKADAVNAGKDLANAFDPQWKPELFSLYYCYQSGWHEAMEKAGGFDWKGAMDIWMGLLDTKDLLKQSCLCFNIATACYMLGEYELASEWLYRSDRINHLPLSSVLRKRIDARK